MHLLRLETGAETGANGGRADRCFGKKQPVNNACSALLGPALLATSLIVLPLPAAADCNEIGQIVVHDQGEPFMRDFSLARPVERLRLKTDSSDIFCRSVLANFLDGNSQEIFDGVLQHDQFTDIELPGDDQRFQSLTFQCGALTRGSAKIHIIVDVGRYRDEWRRNSDT